MPSRNAKSSFYSIKATNFVYIYISYNAIIFVTYKMTTYFSHFPFSLQPIIAIIRNAMSNPAHCPAAWLFPLSPFITVPLIIILALLSHCSTTMTMAEQLMNRSSTFANAISGTASSAEVPAFGSALLELASDLLGGGGEKNTKKNHEHREDGTQNQRRRSPHHRHRQFFGSSGPLFSQEPEVKKTEIPYYWGKH
jgi:hypothetical protein